MKKIFKSLALVVIAVLLIAPAINVNASQSVYSGKSIVYKKQVLIGTTNLGGISTYKVAGNKIVPVVSQHTFEYVYGGGKDYSDMAFSEENGHLFVYATNGRTIFKYDFTDTKTLVLVKEFKNTTWDFVTGIKRAGNKIVTIGTNGVRVYNFNLEVVDKYVVYNQNAYNIDLANDAKNIYSLSGNGIEIYNLGQRRVIATTTIVNAKGENRKVLSTGNYIYAVDDNKLMKIDNAAKIVAKRTVKQRGYDVVAAEGSQFGYFTNGDSIEKFKLSDLKTVKAIKANTLVKNTINWAVGMTVVKTDKGEQVVVFNNESIVILDANLKVVATVKISK